MTLISVTRKLEKIKIIERQQERKKYFSVVSLFIWAMGRFDVGDSGSRGEEGESHLLSFFFCFFGGCTDLGCPAMVVESKLPF